MLNLAAADTLGGVCGTATAVTYSIFGMEYVSSTETYKKLAQGQLGTSAAAVYTVPGSTTAWIEEIRLANASSNAVAGVILFSGGTAAANQITGSFTIPANGTCIINRSGMAVLDSSGSNYVATTPSNLSASISAASAGINSTETSVVSVTIPANYLTVGKSFRLVAGGVCTSSAANASNFRARIGTAGTSADVAPAVVTPTAAASGTAIPFWVFLEVVVRTLGSGGSIIGGGWLNNNGVTGVSAAAVVVGASTATVAVNTTVQNILQLSYVAAASTTTCTFHVASIQEVVK